MPLLILAIALLIFTVSMVLVRTRALPPYLEEFIAGKSHYLVLGFVLGLVSHEIGGTFLLQQVYATFLGLLVCWLGLQLGIRAEFRQLRRSPVRILLFDASQSAVSFLLVLGIVLTLMPRLSRSLVEGTHLPPLALLLSASVSTCFISTRGGAWGPPAGSSPGTVPSPHLILGNFLSILLIAIITTRGFLPHPVLSAAWRFVAWADPLLLVLLIGIGAGILLDMAFRVEPGPPWASYLSVALITATGGLCMAVDLPAIFAGLIAGTWLINTTLRRKDVLALGSRATPVVESLFLVLLGALIGGVGSRGGMDIRSLVFTAMLIFFGRSVARTVGVGVLWRLLRLPVGDHNLIVTGLLPLGSLGLAACAQPLLAASGRPSQGLPIMAGLALATILSHSMIFTFPAQAGEASGKLSTKGD